MNIASGCLRHAKLLALLLVLSAPSACGQALNLTCWQADSLAPSAHASSLYAWGFARQGAEWVIARQKVSSHRGDSLVFTKPTAHGATLAPERADRYVKRITSGYLVGINYGEFGGGLYFVGLDGTRLAEIETSLRVRQIFEFDHRLFAAGGFREGCIEELLYREGTWQARQLTHLPEPPLLTQEYGGDLLVVSQNFVHRVGPDFKVVSQLQLPPHSSWPYPSALLVAQGDLYLALGTGILHVKQFLKPRSGTPKPSATNDREDNLDFEWYVPKQ